MWETLDQELQELPAFPTLIAGDTHHSNNHLCCHTLQTNVLNTQAQAQAQPSCLKSLRREHKLQHPPAPQNYIPLVCNLVQVWYQPKPQAQIDVIIIIVVIAIIRIGRRAVCRFILTWGEGKYSRRGSLDLEGRGKSLWLQQHHQHRQHTITREHFELCEHISAVKPHNIKSLFL